ncbi:MAG: Uma2 family endonuclease [Lachnospiraceae bacterium]|nr:Uma2 family endonuclease [Lachnospiraceae bacterium]
MEYWIVDPTKEQIMVYRFEMETMEQYSFAEDVPVGIFDNFSICIQQFLEEIIQWVISNNYICKMGILIVQK